MKTEIREISFENIDIAVKFANKQFELDFYEFEPRLYRSNFGKTYGCFSDNILVGMFSTCEIAYGDLRGITIGTVCVDKTHRNQGVMSSMLNYAQDNLYEGYDFALLSGAKSRYENFGFARCVKTVGFTYCATGKSEVGLTQVVDDSFDKKLFEIDQKFGNGVTRSQKMYTALRNANSEVFLLRDGGKQSLAVVRKDCVTYLCGNVEVNKVVNTIAKRLNLHTLTLLADCNKTGFELAKGCEKYLIQPIANIKILNFCKFIEMATPKQRDFDFDFCVDGEAIRVSCIDKVIKTKVIEKSNNVIGGLDFTYSLFNYNPFDDNLIGNTLYLCLPYTFATIDCI